MKLYDFEMHQRHGTPIGRDRALAERRKRERWGPDRHYWTRAGRRQMNRLEYKTNRHLPRLAALAGLNLWELENDGRSS